MRRTLFVAAAGIALGLAGCQSKMDKPSMDEPLTVDTALDAEKRLTGGRDTLLAPSQQPMPQPGTEPAQPDFNEAEPAAFPDGLAEPPRPARRKREP